VLRLPLNLQRLWTLSTCCLSESAVQLQRGSERQRRKDSDTVVFERGGWMGESRAARLNG